MRLVKYLADGCTWVPRELLDIWTSFLAGPMLIKVGRTYEPIVHQLMGDAHKT